MGCAFRLVIISLRQTGNFLTVNLSCSFVNFFHLGGKIREVNLPLKCQIIRSSYCRKLFAERSSSREIDVFLFGKKTCQRNFFLIFLELKRIGEAKIFDEILVTSETKTNSECRFGIPKKR